MKTFQKSITFILTLIVLIGTTAFSFPVLVNAASASDFVIKSGVLTEYKGTDETVTIPEGVTSIGESAFYNKPIKQVVFPKSLKSIGGNAFIGSNLTSADIPEGVTSIGDSAFASCMDLKEVKLPKSLSSIGNQAFYNTPWFVTYPKDMLIINDILVQYYPEDVADVTIPQGVKTINYKAFANNSRLHTVVIPNSVTTIKSEAFSGSALTSIVIPPSVTTMEDRVFYCCDQLTNITLSPNAKHLGERVLAACYSLKNVSIPKGVESIGNYAFAQDGLLKTLSIPNTVTSIGESILINCYTIKELTVPASVKKIGRAIADVDYSNVDATNPDIRFIFRGYRGTAIEKYVENYPQYRFISLGEAPVDADNLTYNGREYKGAVTLDTRTYTMAPGNIYDIGVKLAGNASAKTRRMTSSRDGIASVRQLPNGNYRVTALRPGTTYITFTIYNPKDGKTEITHSSIKFVVTAGVKQNGVACRQTTYFN
ncbi:leucine-rich repeat domain-containing protein [Clostridium minihomine]|uniref:leucine-rich repeat domain-containing protein n=1 Tax=Clostridium minihomine TaxID=2045012 RepID=UPI0013EB336A|nr:leucine-rich repeat domain-containing protein [Clostridium minihomine]